jgi:hypothetical protein
MNRRATFVFIMLLLNGSVGCVDRRLSITSDPPGALVYMNEKEIGRTPIDTDFLWYGTYDVQVRRDGYQTINQPQQLKAPWWQWPPFDLIAELMPWRPKDQQQLHFTLSPRVEADTDPQALIQRGQTLRDQLESSPGGSGK